MPRSVETVSDTKKKTATVSGKIKIRMTVEELESSKNGPVYVTNKSRQPNRGLILITVDKPNGGKATIRVPKTFVPVDISLQVPRSILLGSTDLRTAINNKLIELNTREYAEYILGTEEGRTEWTRVKNEMLKNHTAVKNALMNEEESTAEDNEDEYLEVKSEKAKKEPKETKAAKETEKKKVDIKLQSLVSRLKEAGDSPIKVVNELKNYGEFSKKELTWLAVQFKSLPRVLKFLKSQMEGLTVEG